MKLTHRNIVKVLISLIIIYIVTFILFACTVLAGSRNTVNKKESFDPSMDLEIGNKTRIDTTNIDSLTNK